MAAVARINIAPKMALPVFTPPYPNSSNRSPDDTPATAPEPTIARSLTPCTLTRCSIENCPTIRLDAAITPKHQPIPMRKLPMNTPSSPAGGVTAAHTAPHVHRMPDTYSIGYWP